MDDLHVDGWRPQVTVREVLVTTFDEALHAAGGGGGGAAVGGEEDPDDDPRRLEARREAARKRRREQAARAAEEARIAAEQGAEVPATPPTTSTNTGPSISPLTVLLGPKDHDDPSEGARRGRLAGVGEDFLAQVLGSTYARDPADIRVPRQAPSAQEGAQAGTQHATGPAAAAAATTGASRGGVSAAAHSVPGAAAGDHPPGVQLPASVDPHMQAPHTEPRAPPLCAPAQSVSGGAGAVPGGAAVPAAGGGAGMPARPPASLQADAAAGNELLALLLGPEEMDNMVAEGEAAAAAAAGGVHAAGSAPAAGTSVHSAHADGGAGGEAPADDGSGAADSAGAGGAALSQPQGVTGGAGLILRQPRIIQGTAGGQSFLELLPAAATAAIPSVAPGTRAGEPSTPVRGTGGATSHGLPNPFSSPLRTAPPPAGQPAAASPHKTWDAQAQAAEVARNMARVAISAQLLQEVSEAEAGGAEEEREEGGMGGSLLPPEQRLKLSRWGERLVYRYLLAHPKVQSGSWQVVWVNQGGESGAPYDIELRPRGYAPPPASAIPDVTATDDPRVFIEVKTTSSADKRAFEVSPSEVSLALAAGHRYAIYRVFSAGTPQSSLAALHDPSALWHAGALRVCMVL